VAVSPFYRKIGVATYILNHAHMMARQLGKSALELSVLKTNLPALRLYRKSGFREKKEKRRSLILGKDLENVSGV
jgi:ribosomal protein S18 acetylase RimI-like enzyme